MAKRYVFKRRTRKHGRNPSAAFGSSNGVIKSITSGFSLPNAKSTATMAGGAIANHLVAGKLTELLGRKVDFLRATPGKTNWAGIGVSVLTAGAMLMVPKLGKELFAGAMTYSLVSAVNGTGAVDKIKKSLGLAELDYPYGYRGLSGDDALAELNELIYGQGMGELDYANR